MAAFVEELRTHGGDPRQIELVSIDMSPAFQKGVRNHLPQARIVFDHFHLMQMAGRALDDVRKLLRREGAELSGALWAIRGNAWTHTVEQTARPAQLARDYPKLGRAMMLREALQDVLSCEDPAELHWWVTRARRARLLPFRKLAYSVMEHWEDIVAFLQTRVTNGVMEAINGVLQLAKRLARGFRSFRSFRLMALLKQELRTVISQSAVNEQLTQNIGPQGVFCKLLAESGLYFQCVTPVKAGKLQLDRLPSHPLTAVFISVERPGGTLSATSFFHRSENGCKTAKSQIFLDRSAQFPVLYPANRSDFLRGASGCANNLFRSRCYKLNRMNPTLLFHGLRQHILSLRLQLVLVLSPAMTTSSVQAQQPLASAEKSSVDITAPISLDAYRLLRTPIVTLTLGVPAKGSPVAALAKLSALAGNDAPATPNLIQPQSHNGVFDEVNLGYLDGSGKPPAPANVSLQFDASRAGTTVWVQPLDGGAILALDSSGNPVSKPEGYAFTLNVLGQLVFAYQAFAQMGRYQVLIRLDDVSTILPFIIPNPNQDN